MASFQTVGNSVGIGAALGAVAVAIDQHVLHWDLTPDTWAAILLISIAAVSNFPDFLFRCVEAIHGKPPVPIELPERAAEAGADESRKADDGTRKGSAT